MKKSVCPRHLGFSCSADLYRCEVVVTDEKVFRDLLDESVENAGCHAVANVTHRYHPQGISGVVVIQESHISIHTWPENSFLSIDAYACGEDSRAKVRAIIDFFVDRLEPKHLTKLEIHRGNPMFLDNV